MSHPHTDQRELLDEVRAKGRALLAQLITDQAELERNPPVLPAEQLVEGRAALANAIASARRMCEALDAAAALDEEVTDETDP